MPPQQIFRLAHRQQHGVELGEDLDGDCPSEFLFWGGGQRREVGEGGTEGAEDEGDVGTGLDGAVCGGPELRGDGSDRLELLQTSCGERR